MRLAHRDTYGLAALISICRDQWLAAVGYSRIRWAWVAIWPFSGQIPEIWPYKMLLGRGKKIFHGQTNLAVKRKSGREVLFLAAVAYSTDNGARGKR